MAIVVGLFLGFAGVMHFVSPQFFNDIVPPWLPPSESFWTYASGVVELVVAYRFLWSLAVPIPLYMDLLEDCPGKLRRR